MRMRKAVASGLTALLATAALAGCGDAPESSASGGDGGSEETPAALDFLPCMVSDAGGFDDKSFNQLGYEGLEQAADELGVEFKARRVQQRERLRPEHREPGRPRAATLIVTVGLRARRPRPRRRPRPTPTSSSSSSTTLPTVATTARPSTARPTRRTSSRILFDTAQAAFLAGYAAAGFTRRPASSAPSAACSSRPSRSSWTASTQGVEYYNEQKGKDVKVVGWDGEADGVFTGGFEANETATNTAQELLDQDVDVILPVGGPIYQSAADAPSRDSGARHRAASVSTPTCSRPTRTSRTCSSPRS